MDQRLIVLAVAGARVGFVSWALWGQGSQEVLGGDSPGQVELVGILRNCEMIRVHTCDDPERPADRGCYPVVEYECETLFMEEP